MKTKMTFGLPFLVLSLPVLLLSTAGQAPAQRLDTTTFIVMGEGLAAGMANFGLDFINFMFLTWYPSYLTATYHMSLGRMGVMAMEPYLFGIVSVLGAGRLVRAMCDNGMDSVTARRIVPVSGQSKHV